MVLNSESEDLDQVDCKVEEQGYNFQGTWSSPTPDSPVGNPFGGNSAYPLGGQSAGGSTVYGRGHQNEKWSMNDSLLSSSLTRQEVGWSSQNPTVSSVHMGRRRENSLQSDAWPSIQSQSQSSSRWQGTTPDTSPTSPSSTATLYQERTRIRSGHPFDDGQMIHRRENEGVQTSNFPHRYNPHPNGREGALQRLQWRDVPAESGRDHRRVNSTQTNHSFPHSPTIPFNSQSYHSSSTPTYSSSWTQSDSNMMTPTLHPIPSTQSSLAYDGSYSSTVSSAPISSPEEFTTVDDQYRDS